MVQDAWWLIGLYKNNFKPSLNILENKKVWRFTELQYAFRLVTVELLEILIYWNIPKINNETKWLALAKNKGKVSKVME